MIADGRPVYREGVVVVIGALAPEAAALFATAGRRLNALTEFRARLRRRRRRWSDARYQLCETVKQPRPSHRSRVNAFGAVRESVV